MSTQQEGYFMDNYQARWRYFEQHSGLVYQQAMKLTGDKAKAEALVTQAFQNAYERYANSPCPKDSNLYLLSQINLLYSQMQTAQPAYSACADELFGSASIPPAPMQPPPFVQPPANGSGAPWQAQPTAAQPAAAQPFASSAVYNDAVTAMWSPDMVNKPQADAPQPQAAAAGEAMGRAGDADDADEEEGEPAASRSIPLTILNTLLFVLTLGGGVLILYQLGVFPNLI